MARSIEKMYGGEMMVTARIGRPRSEKSREAVLNATHELLNAHGGVLTIEAIAKRAGVGKPTLYRWWPTVADIVLEALLSQADAVIAVSSFISLSETLGQFLRQSMKAILEGGGVHLRFLMAYAQKDDDFRERFRDNFVAKRRDVLNSIFLQALARGEISPEQNLEMLVDIVFGAMWYRLLTGHAPLGESFADELTELVLKVTEASSVRQA